MKAIGIDLGLEQVVVAIMGPTGPTVLDSFENKPEMRSAVSLKKAKGRQAGSGKEEILVGDTAIDNWPMAPADTIVSIKRLMGRSFSDPEVQRVRSLVSYSIEKPDDGTSGGVCVVMGGRQYTPTDISAQLLARVKKAAEFREGCEITHAVITVPAYFGHTQKDATRKAAIQAGLKVIKILDEPTAAAIAFGADSADGSPQTLLVYDLGGGTFDVSVLMLAGSVFAPLNLQGDMWLGGDDFDQAIIDHALECIREEHGLDPRSEKRFMVELKRAAQKVKERLGSGQNADLTVAGLLRDRDDDLIDIDIPFTRQQFERLIVSMVGRYKPCTCGAANLPDDRTCYVCGKTLTGAERKGKALAIVEKALENVQLTKDQVDFVIMAGNSTMVPLVQESMEREFGANKVLRKIHPKQCVALGAAIAAARIGDQVVCQAPDPTNPKQECGQVNEPDAKVCSKCGEQLGAGHDSGSSRQADDDGDANPSGPGFVVGGIAPFSYGTQSAGDKFNVFVQKGATYPTPVEDEKSMTFSTGRANQRMVSIPVYGGEDPRASANDEQGNAFAVLPGGLAEGTAVRVLLTLDHEGKFKVGAWLGSGTDLKPWIVKGGKDARVIELIESIEEKLADPRNRVPTAEKKLEDVFDCLGAHRFDDGRRKAEDLLEELDASDGPADDFDKANGMRVYAEYVIREFAWAFGDQAAVTRLTLAAAAVSDVVRRKDRANLGKALTLLEGELERLPKEVQVLMGIAGTILGEVTTANPVLGEKLLGKFKSILEDIKRGNWAGGERRLEQLMEEIQSALKQIGKEVKCISPACGAEMPPGTKICPACGTDQRILVGGRPRYLNTI